MGLLLALAAVAPASSVAAVTRTEVRADCLDVDPLRRPFFGDTHVHTTFSFDAWGQGTLATPRDAYRFARGESIGIQPYDAEGRPGARVRLRRPLDFAVVTDHSDLLGETRICRTPGLPGHGSLTCRVVRRFPALGYALVNGHVYSSTAPRRYSFCGAEGSACLEAAREPWLETREAAEAFYDRSEACSFTTFVGYEWTGMPDGNNLHRNVIFRNDRVQAAPTTYIETPEPEGLWSALERQCLGALPGCDVLAIPHNSNVSGGLMWTTTREDGRPLTAADARRRERLERLVEVTQHKGDSECRAGAEDELCGFETFGFPRMADMLRPDAAPPVPDGTYVREALGQGLVQQTGLGVNPFAFGLIGSTDTHFGTPGMVDEDRHLGHAAGPVSARFGVPAFPDFPLFNPGGLAVLWADENSRDALFEAMRRREAYGTSGPRIVVRLFGGWTYPEDLCADAGFVERGYAEGVPMGGDLPPPPGAAPAPRFAVAALRDPGGSGAPSTPLQRIQIVKGWVEDGRARERVFDVAGRADTGADVDPATCSPRGEGFDELCSVWVDPDFRADAPAFYYARVVENPSCRWNAWVCLRRGVDCREPDAVDDELAACCDPALPRTIQERAWTSPIWYTPSASAGADARGEASVR